MRCLHVHAHQDDFEFVASGTFELLRRALGNDFRSRLIVCTDGEAGHHVHSREKTGEIRRAEQLAAARLGGLESVQLTDLDGNMFREGCIDTDARFLAALWNAIREFEPDYLFCPPVPADPLAGVHPDHLSVADGIRRVAYLLNVPHAFTPEYPSLETTSTPRKVPVIINVRDDYMKGANSYDFAVNIDAAFDHVVDMTWCHQSQICEWLPWVDRHGITTPRSKEDWAGQLKTKLEEVRNEMGIETNGLFEFFQLTHWGTIPTAERLFQDIPIIHDNALARARLTR